MLFVCILYQDMMVYFKTIQNGSPLFDVELYHTVHKTLIVSTLLNIIILRGSMHVSS
jgi:hypothetical protein